MTQIVFSGAKVRFSWGSRKFFSWKLKSLQEFFAQPLVGCPEILIFNRKPHSMATFTTFEEIDAWKRGHHVALEIYRITNTAFMSRDFGLKDQMRRSAVSITSNIAEGFDRRGNKEFGYFLNVSKGSSSELRSQVILAKDLGYMIELNKMIGGLMKYLQNH
jgi:four helix bundle protein